MIVVLMRGVDTQMGTQKERGVLTEAEIGVTSLQAREHRATRSWEEACEDSTLEPSEGAWPHDTLISD